jgi:hypothetical protein
MKTLSLVIASLIMVCGLSLATNAQTDKSHWNIDARERNQQKRIAEGIENGSLTPREAARLEHNETEFDQLEARLRASGGRLTSEERERLERRQNELSREIYRLKHDAQGRRP